ncbi:MAG: hypothetical protein NVSMB27_22020 [Ktedonobacteraceae bacterium]
MAEIQEAALMDALRECYDPEIPVNIVDLGLVYEVEIDEATGHVQVRMTLTASSLPGGWRYYYRNRNARLPDREREKLQG